ncbi:MAG: methyltransferase domain-containing protein, partial [Chloroflexota bacterium]|nr:methyltransferase domain-containing protein [Chloroflexota bacterium]
MTAPQERYTHGHHESVLRSHRWRTAENSAAYLLPHLRPGLDVLDVGCGPGTITLDIARLVAPGRVVGIDAEGEVLRSAATDATDAGLTNVVFEVGDAYALAFDDGGFDVVHAHQVLQHLADPVAALAEMRRVTKAGGVVAARDMDLDSIVWYPDAPALDRWVALYGQVTRSNGGEPRAGRRLLAWAHAAGFADVTASASVWCYASPEERAWWGSLWADRVTHSAFADQALAAGLS